MHSGLPIDILFDPVDNSQTALVCFHGAIAEGTSLPFFLGRGVTEGLGATRIFVSDPTLVAGEGFSLGWYIGSAAQPLLAPRYSRSTKTQQIVRDDLSSR